MNHPRLARCMACLLLSGAVVGCNRNDTERLANIGRIVAERTGARLTEVREDHFGSVGVGKAISGGLLASRVHTRLRLDRDLADAAIEVHAAGAVIELKGTVKDTARRQRAVDLATTTVGVAKVKDSLKTE